MRHLQVPNLLGFSRKLHLFLSVEAFGDMTEDSAPTISMATRTAVDKAFARNFFDIVPFRQIHVDGDTFFLVLFHSSLANYLQAMRAFVNSLFLFIGAILLKLRFHLYN